MIFRAILIPIISCYSLILITKLEMENTEENSIHDHNISRQVESKMINEVETQYDFDTDSEDNVSIRSNTEEFDVFLNNIRRLNEMEIFEKRILFHKINRRNRKLLNELSKLSSDVHIMILLSGIPGSGKSTFAKRIISAYEEAYNQNSKINFTRGWVTYTQDQFNSRRTMESYCFDALSKGYNLIVDRCNFDEHQRKHWIDMMHSIYAAYFHQKHENSNHHSHHNKNHPESADMPVYHSQPFYILSILVPYYDNVPVCSARAFKRGDDGLHDGNTDWNMVCNRMLSEFRYPIRAEGIDGVFHCKTEKDTSKIVNALVSSHN